MKNFDARAYSIADFLEWHETELLDLSPNFQRRSVWTSKAKSYLIDTIIKGKPMPKVLITQKVEEKRNVRTVVDGQQRLRAIIEYVEDGFALSRAHNADYPNKKFSQLPIEVKESFYKYEIGVDLLYDVALEDLLDIFARINTYNVKLNSQEKLNAKYLGYFKNYAYRLGYKFVQYFLDAGVLTNFQVSRMKEAELSSDLLISIVDGVQTNKNIEGFYKKYEDMEDSPEELELAAKQFEEVMKFIGGIYSANDLRNTNWKRIHFFYSLFNAIYHGLYGLKDFNSCVRPKIKKDNISVLRVRLDDISARYDDYTAKDYRGDIPRNYKTFIDNSRRATTDTAVRKSRAKFICEELSK